MGSVMRRCCGALGALALTVGLLAGPFASPAHAEGVATTFVAQGSLSLDGSLRVDQTMVLGGDIPGEVVQRLETREDALGDRQYVRQVSDITANAGGQSVTPGIEQDGRFLTITVPTGGSPDISIGYSVIGAVVNTEQGTALRWPLLQGLSAQVSEFSGEVQIPTAFSYVRCVAGPPNTTVPCNSAAGGSEQSPSPSFADGPRGEGEVVAVDIGFPPGAMAANEEIEQVWTFARGFSAKPLPLALAVGLLVLGGLGVFALHRRAGVDAHPGAQTEKVGEFAATGAGQTEFRVVGDVRPGHVGTVADERVDPIDVTATVLDLAVRGHLLITELPRKTEFAPTDWTLTRREMDGELLPFEAALLNGISEDSSPVLVSEMANRVQESLGEIQDQLYDEVVKKGWYDHRPDATRDRWTNASVVGLILAIVVTGVLVAFTSFGFVGLAGVALALGLAFVAQEMPSRTPKGSALLSGLGILRSDLMSHPTDQMPPGRELQEISEVLPYAVVLGGTDRWLDAIVEADNDIDPDATDLSWYHAPQGWHLRDLPDSLRNFITTVSGHLFSR